MLAAYASEMVMHFEKLKSLKVLLRTFDSKYIKSEKREIFKLIDNG